MERLHIDLGKDSYPIVIEDGLLKNLNVYMEEADKWVIITDDIVDGLYGQSLYEKLKDQFNIIKYVIPSGEVNKNISTITNILSYMLEHQLTRKSRVLALGGGVVGDMAGFCASIYMRGIDFIQVPTTLLAQVDSSVGGKTGVNMPQGKNLVGTFYQPKTVVIDTEVLKTLPIRELISGIGEVLKYGVIYDYEFFCFLKDNLQKLQSLDQDVLTFVIKKCCEIKAEIVSSDEKENGLRKILNFGHTIGHGLEAVTNYEKYTHGEAVLIGMYLETKLAFELAMIEEDYFVEIESLLKAFQTQLNMISVDGLINAMKGDKKNQEDKISFILPNGRGTVTELLLSPEEIKGLLKVN